MHRAVLPIFTLTFGCADYALHQHKDTPAAGDTGDTFDPDGDSATDSGGDTSGEVPAMDIASNASIQVIFQYSNFGADAQPCTFDVAFYTVADDDGYGDGGTGQTITMPSTAGTCAFTSFDPDDAGSAGSMTVLGTLDAGDELRATNADHDITLAKESGEDGSVRYRWNGCTQAEFPFGQALSLSGDGAEGAIPAFDLADVIAVGPDVTQTAPAASDLDLGILPHSVSDPLDWQWTWSGGFPTTSEGDVAVSQMWVLRNQRRSDNALLEALACMPLTDGALTVPADDLSQLTPDPGDDSIYASAQLDTYFSGAEADAPWGQTVRAQSLISVSGILRLSP